VERNEKAIETNISSTLVVKEGSQLKSGRSEWTGDAHRHNEVKDKGRSL
jgi:hypothetical protein